MEKKKVKIGDIVWDLDRKGKVQDIDLANKRVLIDWETNGRKFTSWRKIEGLDYRTWVII